MDGDVLPYLFLRGKRITTQDWPSKIHLPLRASSAWSKKVLASRENYVPLPHPYDEWALTPSPMNGWATSFLSRWSRVRCLTLALFGSSHLTYLTHRMDERLRTSPSVVRGATSYLTHRMDERLRTFWSSHLTYLKSNTLRLELSIDPPSEGKATWGEKSNTLRL